MARLSEVADITMGQSPTGDKCLVMPNGLPLLNGPTEFGSSHPIPAQWTTDPKRMALTGDLLFCVRGSTTGRMNWADQDYAIGRGLAGIRHKQDQTCQPWIRGVIELQLASLLVSATGSTFPNVSKEQLHSLEVPDHSLTQQREIAAILGALDDKIEVNRKASATLEEMARALYRSWFVDFDPVHAKAEGRSPAYMDAPTAALFPDSFGDDGLPVGWRSVPVGELLTLNYGKALKKELRIAGEYPVYGSGGSDTSHEQALVQQPTIIVGRKGTVGSLYWEPRGCWPIDTVFYVTSDLPLPYIYRMLQELPLEHMNTDAAVPGLNRDNAYRLKVAFPGSQLIAAYEQTAGAFQARIDSLENESRTLAALRDTLLPRLMSGELRVGEARELVEEVA